MIVQTQRTGMCFDHLQNTGYVNGVCSRALGCSCSFEREQPERLLPGGRGELIRDSPDWKRAQARAI